MKPLEKRYHELQTSGGSPALLQAYRAVIEDLADRTPLGAVQRDMVLAIERSDGGLCFEQLVQLLGRSRTRAQEIVSVLCDRGFIRRADDGTDSDGPWVRTSLPLGLTTKKGRPPLARARVVRILSDGQARTRSEIVEIADMPANSVSATLAWLEANGRVRRVDGRRWQLVRIAPAAPLPVKAGETRMACEKRGLDVTVTYCLDQFNEAYLHRDKSNPCWDCRQGAVLRLKECWELPPTPRRISALFAFSEVADAPRRVPAWVVKELNLDPAEFETAAASSEVSP